MDVCIRLAWIDFKSIKTVCEKDWLTEGPKNGAEELG
jgi:hypothetical protein